MRKRVPPDGRIAVIFLLALSARLLYIASTPPASATASIDAWGYHRLALNLALGNGFSLDRAPPFQPDSVRTPLYPLFLLLIRRTLGAGPRAASLAQAVLDSITALLTYHLAAQCANKRAGRIAALLYALNPTQVRYTNDLLTETVLTFLLTACILFFVQYIQNARCAPRGAFLTAALLAALSILCKPNALLVPLILAAILVWRHWPDKRRLLAHVGLWSMIVAITLSPWLIRNRIVFGRWFLSTAFEGNVSRVSAPAAMLQAQMRYPAPWSDEWEGRFLELVSRAAAQYGWGKAWPDLTAPERDRQNHQLYLVARETLRAHPVAWITSHLQGMLRYLEPQTYKICYQRFAGRVWPADVLDDAPIHFIRWISGGHWIEAGQVIVQDRWQKLDALQRIVWWGTFAGQILGLGLMLRGIWKLGHRRQAAATLWLIAAGLLLLPGPIAYERFRTPAMGLILSLIGASSSTGYISLLGRNRASE